MGFSVSAVVLPKITEKLPEYVIDNDPNCKNKDVLRQKAKQLTFPLSQEDLHDIAVLNAKYDGEENCAGLAAPQIGINKAAIIFEVLDDPKLKKWRPDLVQSMPKSIWINPSYETIGHEKRKDYEGCFSVKDTAAEVERHTEIIYTAYDLEGNKITGTAKGFLARAIQHEIDHTNGILYTDIAVPGSVMSIEAYRKKRIEAMEKESDS